MRSYRRCYRTSDFRTIFAVPPPGLGIANPGENAQPGQVSKNIFRIGSLFEGKPYFAIQLYNILANTPQIVRVDDNGSADPSDWTILETFGGLQFANEVFDIQFYVDHPPN